MAAVDNNDPVRRQLRARGAAEHVVREGGEGLIRRWRDFVREVENGYPVGLYDYRNDLDLRTLIASVGLDAEVAPEDARLRELLTGTDRPIWESDVPGAFWVRGYPRNAGGELRDDLISEGFVQ